MNIGAIILAAGASTRLGSPKQLLLYAGAPLIQRAARTVLATACRPVIAVLGANAESVQTALGRMDVQVVVNPAWPSGMGTSLRLGISAFPPEVAATLVLVCDQPFVEAADLESLLRAFRSAPAGKTMAAARYNSTLGVPAVFAREHFSALQALPDDAGAKRVLLAQRQAVIEVEMPNAAVDIDTRAQYERLLPQV